MIHKLTDLTDFKCLDISIFLIFRMFCLSEFISNCKSNVDKILNTNLALYHNKVSSPYSPDKKKLFISNSRLRRLLWKCRKAAVAKFIKETCPEFSVSLLAWNKVAFEAFDLYLQQPQCKRISQ